MATRLNRKALNAAVGEFIDDARQSGLIDTLIETHGVAGKLQVAQTRTD